MLSSLDKNKSEKYLRESKMEKMAGPPTRRECNNDVACECCVSGMTDAWTGGKRVGFFTQYKKN